MLSVEQPSAVAGGASYYDRLSLWTAVSRMVGYGGGRGELTVHRALADPRHAGRPTTTRLHDVLLESLPPLEAPRVFDAGCGLGGTMLHLASHLNGVFTGMTLSRAQAAIGQRAIDRAELKHRIRVTVGNYDEVVGPFDLIVAIESLAHSSDPERSVRALTAALAPGGLLIVIDDMPLAAARGTDALAAFQTGWRVPVLWSEEQYLAAFTTLGLQLAACRNLTAELRPRTATRIGRLERLNRALRRITPTPGLRAILDSHHGGLALERLYGRALMTYSLLIARRPTLA